MAAGIAPDISGNTSINFPLTRVDESNTVLYQLQNIGDCVLLLDGFEIVGPGGLDFSVVSDFSEQIIPPQSSLDISIEFSPSTPDFRIATLQIFSNAGDEPFGIILQGNGEGVGLISVSPADSLDFGAVCLDSTETRFLTVRNIGSADLNIDALIFSNGAYSSNLEEESIAVGDSAELAIQFTPNAENDFPATVTIISSDPDTGNYDIALSGSGIVPGIGGAPTLNFSLTRVGQSDTQSYQLFNVGACDLVLGDIQIVGNNNGDFSIVSEIGEEIIPPQSFLNISIDFSPSAAGSHTAALQIFSNAGEGPFEVVLQGTGESVPEIVVAPTDLDFGEVCLDSTSSIFITISNIGTADLVIDSLRFSSSTFSSLARDVSIVSDNSTQIEILFSPDVADNIINDDRITAELFENAVIVSNDPDSANYEIALNGAGIAPDISGNTSINFPLTRVGESNTVLYQLQNSGDCVLLLDGFEIVGPGGLDFSVVSDFSEQIILPQSSLDISIEFSPSIPDFRIATLQIFSNAGDEPFGIILQGNGEGVGLISVSPADSLDFGAVCLDSTETRFLTVRNIGSADLNIDALIFSNGAYSSNLEEESIAVGDSAELAIQFTPNAENDFPETVTIISSDPDTGNYDIALSGSGIVPAIGGAPTLNFSLTRVGQSDTQSYQLFNVGACDLVLGDIQIAGNNNGDFSIVSEIGEEIIPPQSFLNISIDFSPSAAGSRTAALQIFSNAGEGPL